MRGWNGRWLGCWRRHAARGLIASVVRTLAPRDVPALRLPGRRGAESVRQLLDVHPGRSVWVPSTLEYALIGPWRNRPEIASIEDLVAVRHLEELLRAAVERCAEHGRRPDTDGRARLTTLPRSLRARRAGDAGRGHHLRASASRESRGRAATTFAWFASTRTMRQPSIWSPTSTRRRSPGCGAITGLNSTSTCTRRALKSGWSRQTASRSPISA